MNPFYGVAPGAQIIPYRVTDSVIVDHVQNNIRDAIRAAIAAKCHVVNISLGALRQSRSLASALDEAYDAGLIVVCAAGQVWGEVIYPGRFNRCVTMGGVGPSRLVRNP
jgi:subtilisin family serine protease